MKKKETGGRIEVKAAVIEELDSETRVIYDGGAHWDAEQERRRERRERKQDLRRRSGGWCTYMERHGEDMEYGWPRSTYYADTTARVKVRYSVNGQTYEKEAVLPDTGGRCWKGKKIYLTLDPSRPEEPLNVSLYESESLGDTLMIWGLMLLPLFVLLLLLAAIELGYLSYPL